MTKPMKSPFEEIFPNLARWVTEVGTVEIGYDSNTESFIRALDEGGMVWSGKRHYENLDDAFRDLEKGIATAIGVENVEPQASHREEGRLKASEIEEDRSTSDKPAAQASAKAR